jgi:RNA polymerase sigma-70 factor (ECF subfamily)
MTAHSPARMTDLAVIPTIPPLEEARHYAAQQAMPRFEDVYRESFTFVWRSLRHLGVAEIDAEDAVQDVFLVVHNKLSSFEHRSQISTWIYGICIRVAQARRRRAHVRRELPTAPEQIITASSNRPPSTPTLDAGDELERREAEDMLDRILDSMPIEQRAVFTLFELDGKTCEEIAVLCEAPIGTVYSRLRLAREAFRRATARLEARERFAQAAQGGAR